MNKIHIFAFLMVIALLASCSGNSFKIDGNLTNLHGKNVRVIFRGDSGIVDERVNLDKKGHFSFKLLVDNDRTIHLLSNIYYLILRVHANRRFA